MIAPVEAVLFDVDDTLCEYRRSTAEMLSLAFDRAGVEPFFTARDYVDRYNDFADDSDDVADLRERCFVAIARDRGRDPDLARRVARAYTEERDHADVCLLPGARETLEGLHGTVPLAAVTNGAPAMQSTKLRTLGLADYFETVVHGGYDAPAKPAPDPFHAALETLEVPPDRALHVGNSVASDVAGAKNAGVRAALLQNGSGAEESGPEPDHVLASLADLPDLL
jgi:putative hydrolase of the HAD superfamily